MTGLQRTLLLAPASIASHPETLNKIVEAHDRLSTDIQMFDRLALGLVSLPESTYDLVLLLSDQDGSRVGSQKLLERDAFASVVASMKAGAVIRSQDGTFPSDAGSERREAILAGLTTSPQGGMSKPDITAATALPLSIRRKGAKADAGPAMNGVAAINGKRKNGDLVHATPGGVGFVDQAYDFDEPEEDDELIDEDSFLTEEDMKRPIILRKTRRFRMRFTLSRNQQ